MAAIISEEGFCDKRVRKHNSDFMIWAGNLCLNSYKPFHKKIVDEIAPDSYYFKMNF